MKHIVLVLGSGLNERGWAKDFSKFGRVTLIQIGFFEHMEIWEYERRIYCGPEIKTSGIRWLDEHLFGFISFLSTIWLALRFSKGAKIDLMVTGFHSSGVAVLLLRWFGKVRKITFFIIDYMPPKIGKWHVRLHRLIIQLVIRFVTKQADEVWLLSPRIKTTHPKISCFVVPMYISFNPTSAGAREEIGYIGHPSYDHALDILFAICKKHSFRLNIIGDSPYLQSIKHLAPPGTIFHGLVNDEETIGKILGKCFCGYAIYRNTGPTSYSYYGFPSKTLFCFASNVPVVITNVAHFNETFEKRGVGRVVEPTPEAIEAAILQLKNNYTAYSQAIDRFRTEWNAGAEAFHRERMSVLLNIKQFGNP
jgi:glycosyltransferase involved in cell wall biosynthesis